ncbi:MAG: homoaconitase [Candidatus Zixiibacteriota bacterium]|nr:MAG: homoaconitase [candidate division Zixibacteria bacterium]
MGQNLVEKIAQRFAVGLEDGQVVSSGDYLSIRPAHVMTHDNTGAVIPKFKAIGATSVADPRQIVFALDHNVQDKGEANLKKYAGIEAFAKEHGIDFYPVGRGIGHQIMCEEGYAWPGTVAVASDSHSNMYGGLGCLGTPVVRTDAAAIWATGRTWWQVPPVARVALTGKLREGVSGKDVIIALCGHFNSDEVLNHAIEFAGDGVECLSIENRLAIANMTTEWGALVGLFPCDRVTLDWLKARAERVTARGKSGVPSDSDWKGGVSSRLNDTRLAVLSNEPLEADRDAFYAKELTLDLDPVSPHVAGPHNVKTFTPIVEMREKKLKIHKAYLLSCVNGRVEDLAIAARVVEGKKVASGVEFYIGAASDEVQAESEQRGDWQKLVTAGAIPLPPGCGPCIGLGKGLLKDNEVGVSATNRNFKGRMGSASAEVYLASPEIVAASAIAGYIDLPGWNESLEIKASIRVNTKPAGDSVSVSLLEGFPREIIGELILCHQDNLNTDGIYPGKYTYQDDITPEQQAEVVMENYDPEFGKIVKQGDILVGGFSFGSGSSREQAATALKYRGLALVIAGSFSETYKRNALNNGFLTIECPELVRDMKEQFGAEQLSVRTGITARLDFTSATLTTDKRSYSLSPVGVAAQELVLMGGLENWVKNKIAGK